MNMSMEDVIESVRKEFEKHGRWYDQAELEATRWLYLDYDYRNPIKIYEIINDSYVNDYGDYDIFRYSNSIYKDDLINNSKWKLTIDLIMIIGKYLETNSDFVNLMKVGKIYQELALMYKMNPISDPSLFLNIQTQHFYKDDDVIKYDIPGLFQYIYWNDVSNTGISHTNSVIKKSIRIGKNFPIEIIDGLIKLPLQTESIENKRFADINFDLIELPLGLIDLGESTFINSSIKQVGIPEGITRIPFNCFMDCTCLTKVDLPNSLIFISVNSFRNTALKKITIPSNVTSIAHNSFYQSKFLSEITWKGENKIEVKGFSFGETAITHMAFPLNIRNLSSYAFWKCQNFNLLIIPSTLNITEDDFDCQIVRYDTIEERSLILNNYDLWNF